MFLRAASARVRPHRPSLLSVTAAALLLLWGCDQDRASRLEEGISAESDVRREFGEPTRTIERSDGSKVLEYPRQPMGTTNYEITIGADGKLAALRQLVTPANMAKIQVGMRDLEVRRQLGQPAKIHRFDLRPDEATWDWNFQDGQQRKVFSVTFGRDNTVIATATQDDPRERDSGR